jgi:hypothetical protein
MSKALLQLGFLSFFVAVVVFELQGFTLFDTIGRAFIVFMSFIVMSMLVLAFASWISTTHKEISSISGAETPAHSTAANKQ